MAISRHKATSLNNSSATAIEGTQYPGWVMTNVSDVTIYLGDSGVTASDGFPVEAGGVFSPNSFSHRRLTGKVSDRLYGISASGTGKSVRVLVAGSINA